MHPLVGNGFQHSSGRVIALGRLLLATLFLLAIWMDTSQPAYAPTATFAILLAYIGFAAMVLLVTWNNWWLDAKIAGPAHAVDILLFALLVLLTDGYTSPFFTFFMFVLLAAAIRWSWHATALTAILLAMLYLMVGMIAMKSGVPFELQRFSVRTGHLVILSLILIWFGTNQRSTRFDIGRDALEGHPGLDESLVEAGLRAAMASSRSTSGLFAWRDDGRSTVAALAIDEHGVRDIDVSPSDIAPLLDGSSFLYKLRNRHALRKDADRNLVAFDPAATLPSITGVTFTEGLAIPVRSGGGEGALFLERIRGLSTDHIDFGEQLATDLAVQIQRHSLLRAAEESAEARSRLNLARDLHDSVVQFLAGAAFRLEAMKRSNASGRDVEVGLNELKQLMLQEQRELRSFITSLRSGPLAAFGDLARDLQSLAERLCRQWDINCEFSAQPAEIMIPTRLRLDAHQLVREAVANAVRHAQAKSVTIELAAISDELRLEVVNDGAAFPKRSGQVEMPGSIRERVEQAGGMLDMARGMGVTRLSISLPIGEEGR